MLFETTYNYAGYAINAAQDEDKNYWIDEKTLCVFFNEENGKKTFRAYQKYESQSFKAFAGDDYKVTKISDNTQSNKTLRNFISVADFLKAAAWQASVYKNQTAINFFVAGGSVDFITTLKTHFGEAFTEEEKEYLRVLIFSRLANFKAWTTIIRDRHLELFGTKPDGEYYKECVVKVNLHLFGVKHFNCDRNNMTTLQQDKISEFEKLMVRMAKKYPAFAPTAIITKSLELYDMMF